MEILGSRIPGLQSAIASGVESVTSGIAETTKSAGVAALSVAQDSFSSEQIGTTSSANLPAVSEAAEYPAPDQYFKRFSGIKSESPISSLAISKTLSDPNFNVPKSLQTFSDGDIRDVMGDIFGSPDNNRKSIASSLGPDVTYDAANRNGRDKSDATSVEIGGGYPATDRFGRDKVEALMDKLAPGEALMDKPAPGEALMWKPTPGEALMWKPTPSAELPTLGNVTSRAGDRFGRDKVEGTSAERVAGAVNSDETFSHKTEEIEKKQEWYKMLNELSPSATERFGQDKSDAASLNDVSYSATDRFGRDQRDSSSVESAAVAGSSDAASSRSIIVVGGKSDASDRSIIVVGGKTPDTYLKTIDDSFNELRQTPTAQTADLFRHQAGAVQNLLSTVDQVVRLQQNFTSNVFDRNIRG